ncbi:hypothetical protein AAKU67_002655 [Oxalobacteraceae bacterium GrIS 2.11]
MIKPQYAARLAACSTPHKVETPMPAAQPTSMIAMDRLDDPNSILAKRSIYNDHAIEFHSASPFSAIAKQQKTYDENQKNQSYRPHSPTSTHTPVQSSATAK